MSASEFQATRRFWFWGFAFLFLAHAFAVFWFSNRQSIELPQPASRAFLYFGGETQWDRRIDQLVSMRDPTLFAMPHAHGFSGGAWLNFRPTQPAQSNWSAPLEWLPLPVEQLGATLEEYVNTNRPSPRLLLAALRNVPIAEIRIPDEPVITGTTVSIRGPLRQRKLISSPALPPMRTNDLVARTVVSVTVNAEGMVESVSLVPELGRELGSKLAEAKALELAKSFEFQPWSTREKGAAAPGMTTMGRLVFTWQVVTNAPAATAGPP